MSKIGAFVAQIPKPVRDFFEGAISVGIAGAAAAVVGLNLVDPTLTARTVELAAATGAISAILAYARRAITPAASTTPPSTGQP